MPKTKTRTRTRTGVKTVIVTVTATVVIAIGVTMTGNGIVIATEIVIVTVKTIVSVMATVRRSLDENDWTPCRCCGLRRNVSDAIVFDIHCRASEYHKYQ